MGKSKVNIVVLACLAMGLTACGGNMGVTPPVEGAVITSDFMSKVSEQDETSYSVLDIDRDGRVDALSDGILIQRYLFGITGEALVKNAISSQAQRTTFVEIKTYLNSIRDRLDIDGDDQADALTDGLLMLRFMFGMTGSALTSHVISSGATRSPTEILDLLRSMRDSLPIIYSCLNITQSGSYKLADDLVASNPSRDGLGCIEIRDVGNVHLDCAGHTITGERGIVLNNVHDFSVSNCTFRPISGRPSAYYIADSSRGKITNNKFAETGSGLFHQLSIVRSSTIAIENNVINGFSHLQISDHITLRKNVFHNPTSATPGDVNAATVIFSAGSDNTFDQNTIDGHTINLETNASRNAGAQTGILARDEKRIVISNNTIRNVWEAGIEWWGHLDQARIVNNEISNALVAGIGAWQWMSLSNSEISFNRVSQSPALFSIFRVGSLRTQTWASYPGWTAAETKVYFTNNKFVSNVLSAPLAAGGSNSLPYPNNVARNYSYIPILKYMGFAWSPAGFNETHLAAKDFVLTNNLFMNNDFSAEVNAPDFGNVAGTPVPSGLVIDGGGNRCKRDSRSLAAGYPIVCNP